MAIRPASNQVRGGLGSTRSNVTLRTTGQQVQRPRITADSLTDVAEMSRILGAMAEDVHSATLAARSLPFMGGTLISGFTPTAATTVINHNLGRPIAGCIVVRAQFAQWTGYESADQNQITGSVASGLLNSKTQVRFVTPTSGTFSLYFF